MHFDPFLPAEYGCKYIPEKVLGSSGRLILQPSLFCNDQSHPLSCGLKGNRPFHLLTLITPKNRQNHDPSTKPTKNQKKTSQNGWACHQENPEVRRKKKRPTSTDPKATRRVRRREVGAELFEALPRAATPKRYACFHLDTTPGKIQTYFL